MIGTPARTSLLRSVKAAPAVMVPPLDWPAVPVAQVRGPKYGISRRLLVRLSTFKSARATRPPLRSSRIAARLLPIMGVPPPLPSMEPPEQLLIQSAHLEPPAALAERRRRRAATLGPDQVPVPPVLRLELGGVGVPPTRAAHRLSAVAAAAAPAGMQETPTPVLLAAMAAMAFPVPGRGLAAQLLLHLERRRAVAAVVVVVALPSRPMRTRVRVPMEQNILSPLAEPPGRAAVVPVVGPELLSLATAEPVGASAAAAAAVRRQLRRPERAAVEHLVASLLFMNP